MAVVPGTTASAAAERPSSTVGSFGAERRTRQTALAEKLITSTVASTGSAGRASPNRCSSASTFASTRPP